MADPDAKKNIYDYPAWYLSSIALTIGIGFGGGCFLLTFFLEFLPTNVYLYEY